MNANVRFSVKYTQKFQFSWQEILAIPSDCHLSDCDCRGFFPIIFTMNFEHSVANLFDIIFLNIFVI